jgi:hypothetical protein
MRRFGSFADLTPMLLTPMLLTSMLLTPMLLTSMLSRVISLPSVSSVISVPLC